MPGPCGTCLGTRRVMTPREPLTSMRAPLPATPSSRFFSSITCAPAWPRARRGRHVSALPHPVSNPSSSFFSSNAWALAWRRARRGCYVSVLPYMKP